MADSITPNAIATMIANPSPDCSSNIPDLVIQVVDLKPVGNRHRFRASDGTAQLNAMLSSHYAPEVESGNLQNLGLICVEDYTVNVVAGKQCLIVSKCKVVASALEAEIKNGLKKEDHAFVSKPKQEMGIQLKPKQEMVAKSAAQILQEQNGNMAPSARMGMTRRVYPLVSLNPYQGNWTIKVRVTSKGNLRAYKNARGEGHVFNVELTDQDGTEIQATMFNEAALKFYDKFEHGKVYYISNGSLRVANKQFKTVQNDYELTLGNNSEVEEVAGDGTFIPETKFNFVPIDQLGSYVNGRELVDVIGVVQHVSPTMSIRRKLDNESIPKRDITIADESKKTVVVSLWNTLATTIGQELLDAVDTAPIVALKALKVGDFQGISLSTVTKSNVVINPDVPESKKLRDWYNSEGKETTMDSVGAGLASNTKNERSMNTERVLISHITNNPSLGEVKPSFFSLKAYVSFIKPDKAVSYRACKTCNKKVTEALGSNGYWCEGCQKNDAECSLRYLLNLKITDSSGEVWVSAFNQQAEKIIGCSAEELENMRMDGNEEGFKLKLHQATWVPHLFRVGVEQREYNNEKKQRITIRYETPLDFVAESKFLLEEISKVQAS